MELRPSPEYIAAKPRLNPGSQRSAGIAEAGIEADPFSPVKRIARPDGVVIDYTEGIWIAFRVLDARTVELIDLMDIMAL
jgi:hypothetical protein